MVADMVADKVADIVAVKKREKNGRHLVGHSGRHGGGQGGQHSGRHVQNQVYIAWKVLKRSVLGQSCSMRSVPNLNVFSALRVYSLTPCCGSASFSGTTWWPPQRRKGTLVAALPFQRLILWSIVTILKARFQGCRTMLRRDWSRCLPGPIHFQGLHHNIFLNLSSFAERDWTSFRKITSFFTIIASDFFLKIYV